MRQLEFDPLISPAWWLALAVAAAALLVVYAWSRPALMSRRRWSAIIVMMALSVALVLAVLLNPTWVAPLPAPDGKPVLLVMVDTSQSMGVPLNPEASQTRYDAAAAAATELARRLNDRFEVRLMRYDTTAAAVSERELPQVTPDGAYTDVSGAIRAALAEDRPQGQALVLLGDGGHNGGDGAPGVIQAANLSRAMSTPIYTRTFGSEHQAVDLDVQVVNAQELLFVDQQATIEVRLSHRGLSGAKVALTLSGDDGQTQHREVTLPPDGSAAAAFQVSAAQPGIYRYEITAPTFPGELSQANNSAACLVQVVDEPIRVLLLEGKPYWDGKFLMRTLALDPAVELDAVVRLTANRLIRRTIRMGQEEQFTDATGEQWQLLRDSAEVLEDAAALARYQIVVLGRHAELMLTDAAVDHLRRWLGRDGGVLLCYRGVPTPQLDERLAAMLPMQWTARSESRFHWHLTDAGQTMPWLRSASIGAEGLAVTLPTLASRTQHQRLKPLAVVLATSSGSGGGAESNPVVVYQRYGAGRVVLIEGAGMWRWALSPPEDEARGEVYGALWHNLMRWLALGGTLLPGQALRLRSDQVTFSTLEPATASLLLREDLAQGGDLPRVRLTGPGDGEERQVTAAAVGQEPGAFVVNFGRLEPGRYEVAVEGFEQTPGGRAVFDVRLMSRELLDLDAQPQLMSHVAEVSGGLAVGAGADRLIADHFQQHLLQSRPPRQARHSAWDRWWILMAIFACWCGSWMLRRQGGLI